MQKFFVSLLPRYFDEDTEAIIAGIRQHGHTANARAYGSGWCEPHSGLVESEWSSKRWKADNPLALERERALAKELAAARKRRAEDAKAAREYWKAEWQREKEQAKKLKAYAAVQARERRERWEQENAFWLNEERYLAERKAKRLEAAPAWQDEAHFEYDGPAPANTDWRLVIYFRRDLGHYTWDTLKEACRLAIVEDKREFMSQIMAFLNLPDAVYDGVLAACTELVSEGKLVRLR